MPLVYPGLLPQLHHSTHDVPYKDPGCFRFQHMLIGVVAGILTIKTHAESITLQSGQLILLKNNQLMTLVRTPPIGAAFKSTSVYFENSLLQNFATEQGYETYSPYSGAGYQILGKNPMYDNYLASLSAYDHTEANRVLTSFKVKEALMLMSFLDKPTGNILYDFSSPGKTEILPFMEEHFRFNATMDKFAFLTGRSLATFKRDFIKNYGTTPGKWLLERRLNESYHLIKSKRRKVSDVYLETGFEDLSHFSFAFKKKFGIAPSYL